MQPCRSASPIHPEVEIDSYGQIKKLVSRGLGYAILPRMAVHKEAEVGIFRVWRFERPEITRKVYLAYSTERPLLQAPRAIGQLAWEILRQLVRDGVWTAELADESLRPILYDLSQQGPRHGCADSQRLTIVISSAPAQTAIPLIP